MAFERCTSDPHAIQSSSVWGEEAKHRPSNDGEHRGCRDHRRSLGRRRVVTDTIGAPLLELVSFCATARLECGTHTARVVIGECAQPQASKPRNIYSPTRRTHAHTHTTQKHTTESATFVETRRRVRSPSSLRCALQQTYSIHVDPLTSIGARSRRPRALSPPEYRVYAPTTEDHAAPRPPIARAAWRASSRGSDPPAVAILFLRWKAAQPQPALPNDPNASADA